MEHNYERNKSLIIVFDYTSFFPLYGFFFTFWTDWLTLYGLWFVELSIEVTLGPNFCTSQYEISTHWDRTAQQFYCPFLAIWHPFWVEGSMYCIDRLHFLQPTFVQIIGKKKNMSLKSPKKISANILGKMRHLCSIYMEDWLPFFSSFSPQLKKLWAAGYL